MAPSTLPTALAASTALAGYAFIAPSPSVGRSAPEQHSAAPSLRQGAASGQAGSSYAALGACLAAAAGAAAVARKRTAVTRPAVTREEIEGKHSLVFVAGFEDVVPVPGSEKALGSMVGADVETGSEIWDPLGFAKLYDRNFDFNKVMVYPHVQWLREAEIKHGRVCMLAFVGMVVQQWYQIPGLPAEPDWIKALDACYESETARLGLVQISVFAMVVEGKFSPHMAYVGQLDREPGDLGFDPLKLTKRANFDLKKKQLAELKNGRLAMIGVASMAANHVIPGSVPFLTGAY